MRRTAARRLQQRGPDAASVIRCVRPLSPAFDFSAMVEEIVKVDGTFWCVYTRRTPASTPQIDVRLAWTTDLATGGWTDYASNPILTLGDQSWENSTIGTNGVCLMEDAGTFYLFYDSSPTSLDTGESADIGVATASSVTGPYTKYAGNPILTRGSSGAWDSLRVQEPSVIKVGSTWIMAYMGESDTGAVAATEKIGVATATSPTGPWTKNAGNPVLGFGSTYDVGCAADPSLFFDGGRYWMLYAGAQANAGFPWVEALAYADDPGGPWTRHPSNPILEPRSTVAFETQGVWRGAIVQDGNDFWINYSGMSDADTSNAKGSMARLVISRDD